MSAAQIAAISHLVGAMAFGALTLLFLTAWRGRVQGGLLVLAAGVTGLWCGAVAAYSLYATPPYSALQLLEVLRDGAWMLFLVGVLLRGQTDAAAPAVRRLRVTGVAIVALCVAMGSMIIANRYASDFTGPGSFSASGLLLGHVVISVLGLSLVEQIYRNSRQQRRWAIKFLCIGIGGLFAYDLYLYALALLFKGVDQQLWMARGAVNALIVPCLAVSARRNPEWSVDVFVSRHFVFHSAAMLGGGVYLLLMAAAGYYIKAYGGTWGGVVQTVFLFGAVMLLGTLMASGRIRSQARVLLSKHFYKNQYDYRDEWLRFTRMLSSADEGSEPRERIVRAIATIVESPGGIMWGRDHIAGTFMPRAAWNAPLPRPSQAQSTPSLVEFLESSGWVVYLDEYREQPDAYPDLELPQWLETMERAWILVPLVLEDQLVGFLVLHRSDTKRMLNWEDSDLLKTVGRQAAGYIALLEATDALYEARQFEAFNRLSAYVVHDLKNIVAQLALVVSNARRHMHSPGFMEDAIETVGNSTDKMNRMLAQLRKGRLEGGGGRHASLREVLGDVVRARSVQHPVPALELGEDLPDVAADPERLTIVVEHLVQNAQDATANDGNVTIRARREARGALIEVCDTGCGMDANFIRDRLFKPFDTTKGNAGMGVGVYESREFAYSVGGRMEVNSVPGSGSQFLVWLPGDGATAGDVDDDEVEVAS